MNRDSTDHSADQKALRKEWLFGAGLVALAFIIALAVAAWLTFGHKTDTDLPVKTPIAQELAQEQQAANDPSQVCRTALGNAQNFGIIPPYGQLTEANPRATDVQGRYLCQAGTSDTAYVLSVDLVCEQISQTQCVNIYSIVSDDGTTLYQRQE